MEAASPWWFEPVIYAIGAAGAGGAGLFAALRKPKEHGEETGPASVVAASVISDKAVEKVTLVIREAAESYHDDTRRHRETMNDLMDCVRDLTRVIKEGLPPVAGVDVAGIMARLSKIERKP